MTLSYSTEVEGIQAFPHEVMNRLRHRQVAPSTAQNALTQFKRQDHRTRFCYPVVSL